MAKYELVFETDTHVLIKDCNVGMSVTNAAEEVVLELNRTLNGGLGSRKLLYVDSQGTYDELLHKDGRFTGFRILDKEILSFDAWLDKNEDELAIDAAETGADRELDFDWACQVERTYADYLES